MPIEIKELVIRTVVNDTTNAREGDVTDGGDIASTMHAAASGDGRDAIVRECVRQVMSILTRNKER
tara:strand:- start:1938 stop:2135 length:198 start_codon:yes stop_codon:yes gene_type:complete